MGTRIVRDGLLESEAVLSLPPEGRWLYVSILLSADDYGLFEATQFKLAKRGDVKREHVPILLQAMVDVDLVRTYMPDPKAMRTFGVVTKFEQRLRGYRSKFPLPPRALVSDQGIDYLNAFNKLVAAASDRRPPTADRGRPETETETETDRELSLSVAPTSSTTTGLVDSAVAASPRTRVAACPVDELIALWHEHCAPPLATVGVLNPARRTALATRWREVCASSGFDKAAGVEWFRWLFVERVKASAFLMGRTNGRDGKSFRCTWDWLMRPTNFAKAVDGNYLDRKGTR